jgi:hypothetical protein
LVQSEQLHEATHSGGAGASILTAPQWQLPVAFNARSPCLEAFAGAA